MQRSRLLDELEGRTIREFKEIYEAFFEQRHLIPRDRFCEIRFEDLEADPLGQLRGLYEALALPDFQVAEPVLHCYVESLAGYQKNTFPEMPADLRTRIAREWKRCFEEWGYPIGPLTPEKGP
jgi:hypothetical protein